MPKGDLTIDPRGLIYEAYRMELGPAECRSIFLDWAIGVDGGAGEAEVRQLLTRYGAAHPDHPMTAVLREGIEKQARPRGRRDRRTRAGSE